MLIYGMKRSGNHAIINWLLPHARFRFFNDIIQIEPVLRGDVEIPAPQRYSAWLQSRTSFGRRFVPQPLRPTVLASIEDHQLSVQPFYNYPEGTRVLLLLRDPANMFASRIRKAFLIDHPSYPRNVDESMSRLIALWKSYAREYLGETSLLPNKVCVYFNAWFVNTQYRKELSKRLGLIFTDEGYSRVSWRGGGSSFDGVEYDGNTSNLKVLDRPGQLLDNEREILETIMMDKELNELASRVKAGACAGGSGTGTSVR